MKGKIDRKGHFLIERSGIFKTQWCPPNDSAVICGDWCPLFEELESSDGQNEGMVILGCGSNARVILIELDERASDCDKTND